jgi:hypothetical protein
MLDGLGIDGINRGVAIIQIIYFELCLVLSKGIRLLSLIVV